MTSETFEEFKARIEGSDWHYGISFDRQRPTFKSPEAAFLELEYPTHPGSIAHASNLAARVTSRYYDRAHFTGATLWFADEPFEGWEQAAGRVVIDRIRAGFGDLRPYSFNLVHTFRREEIELLTAFMILGTVLAWDFYVLPPDGNRIVFMSHDELFGVYTKSGEVKAELAILFGDEIVE
jgi:hypothetical protein